MTATQSFNTSVLKPEFSTANLASKNSDDDIIVRDSQIFGTTSVFIEGRSTFVSSESTTLGNLTADANLFIAKKYDTSVSISITSASSITNSIGFVGDDGILHPTKANPKSGKKEGDISQLDIENALQFNNGLVVLSLTRKQLVKIIEHGISESLSSGSSTRFPQISGLSFSYDVKQPPGKRVRSLSVVDDSGKITDIIVKDGILQETTIEKQQTFRIVTTEFLAAGGEGYEFPDFASTSNQVNLKTVNVEIENSAATFASFGTEQDALAEFLASKYKITPFNIQETTIEQDVRIQNLSVRSDTVLDINVNAFAFTGSAKVDKLFGGNLDDVLRGRGGDDRIIAKGGNDRLFGNGGNDKIAGGFGDDTIKGNRGNDTLKGHRGDDVIACGQGGDKGRGGSGKDKINGDNGNDSLFGGADNDILIGGKGNDILNGGRGDDVLIGGSGDDVLIARTGISVLEGGDGDDLLVAGRGDDTFIISGKIGTDTIRGFNSKGVDILKFESFTFAELTITQVGKDTLIKHDQDILTVLLNVEATTIDTSVFG